MRLFMDFKNFILQIGFDHKTVGIMRPTALDNVDRPAGQDSPQPRVGIHPLLNIHNQLKGETPIYCGVDHQIFDRRLLNHISLDETVEKPDF